METADSELVPVKGVGQATHTYKSAVSRETAGFFVHMGTQRKNVIRADGCPAGFLHSRG